MVDLKNLCQHMFAYNFLLFPQHNLDLVMFKIQLLVVHKFNQNVVVGNLPFNLKQTYQSSYVCLGFLFLSRACPKQNILKIIIITLLYRSKNIPNLNILVSLHLLPRQICNHYLPNLFPLCVFYWDCELSLESDPG
jgi:hypothetical protein